MNVLKIQESGIHKKRLNGLDLGEFLTHGSRTILETDFNIPTEDLMKKVLLATWALRDI